MERKAVVFCNGAPYIWTDTYYRCLIDQNPSALISSLVFSTDRVNLNPSVIKTVYALLSIDDRLQVDIEEESEKNRMHINTRNGGYGIAEQEITQHDGSRKFNYELELE